MDLSLALQAVYEKHAREAGEALKASDSVLQACSEIAPLHIELNRGPVLTIPEGFVAEVLLQLGDHRLPHRIVMLDALQNALLSEPAALEFVRHGGIEKFVGIVEALPHTAPDAQAQAQAHAQDPETETALQEAIAARAAWCLATVLTSRAAAAAITAPRARDLIACLGDMIQGLDAVSQRGIVRDRVAAAMLGILRAEAGGVPVDAAVVRAAIELLSEWFETDRCHYGIRERFEPRMAPLVRALAAAMYDLGGSGATQARLAPRTAIGRAMVANQAELWTNALGFLANMAQTAPPNFSSEAVSLNPTLLVARTLAGDSLDILRAAEALSYAGLPVPAFIMRDMLDTCLFHVVPCYLRNPCGLISRENFNFAAGFITAVITERINLPPHPDSPQSPGTPEPHSQPNFNGDTCTDAKAPQCFPASARALAELQHPFSTLRLLVSSLVGKARATAKSSASPAKILSRGVDGPPGQAELELLASLCAAEPQADAAFEALVQDMEVLAALVPRLFRAADSSHDTAALFGQLVLSLWEAWADRPDRRRALGAALYDTGAELVLEGPWALLATRAASAAFKELLQELSKPAREIPHPTNLVRSVRELLYRLAGDAYPNQRTQLLQALQGRDYPLAAKVLQGMNDKEAKEMSRAASPPWPAALGSGSAAGSKGPNWDATTAVLQAFRLLKVSVGAAGEAEGDKGRNGKKGKIFYNLSHRVMTAAEDALRALKDSPKSSRSAHSSPSNSTDAPLPTLGSHSPKAAAPAPGPGPVKYTRITDPGAGYGAGPDGSHCTEGVLLRRLSPTSPLHGRLEDLDEDGVPIGDEFEVPGAAAGLPEPRRACAVCSGAPAFGYAFRICSECRTPGHGTAVRLCSVACLDRHRREPGHSKPPPAAAYYSGYAAAAAERRPVSGTSRPLPSPPLPKGAMPPPRAGSRSPPPMTRQDEYDAVGEKLGILL